jgi:hypothetical protein
MFCLGKQHPWITGHTREQKKKNRRRGAPGICVLMALTPSSWRVGIKTQASLRRVRAGYRLNNVPGTKWEFDVFPLQLNRCEELAPHKSRCSGTYICMRFYPNGTCCAVALTGGLTASLHLCGRLVPARIWRGRSGRNSLAPCGCAPGVYAVIPCISASSMRHCRTW